MTIYYLDPLKYWHNPQLDSVLILVPSYKGPHPITMQFLNDCVAAGADITPSWGCSDVAMHRCIVAGAACQRIVERSEMKKPISHVVWIDDDMMGTPSHVAGLMQLSNAIGGPVTGHYCKRGSSNVLTLKRYPWGNVVRVRVRSSSPDLESLAFDAQPVTAGMGCLCVPAAEFLEHCERAPKWSGIAGANGKGSPAPGICASGMCTDSQGRIGWMSEDQTYCEGLWQYGFGLWEVPIEFAHISEVPLRPSPTAEWLPNPELLPGEESLPPVDVEVHVGPILTSRLELGAAG